MPNWKTIITSAGATIGEVKINRGIFQGDSLSPLLFVIMIPLTLILRKVKAGYKMSKTSSPMNHLLFMDDLKLYSGNKNRLDSLVNTVKLFSWDIQLSFRLSKCAIVELKRGRKIISSGIRP